MQDDRGPQPDASRSPPALARTTRNSTINPARPSLFRIDENLRRAIELRSPSLDLFSFLFLFCSLPLRFEYRLANWHGPVSVLASAFVRVLVYFLVLYGKSSFSVLSEIATADAILCQFANHPTKRNGRLQKQKHTSDFGSHPLDVRSVVLTSRITIANEPYKNFNAPLIAS
jgi:hypothetical protein